MNRRPGAQAGPGVPGVRFIPSGTPVVTSTPPGAHDAVRTAARMLAALGHSHLGGHLVLAEETGGPPGGRAARERAVERAVRHALRPGVRPAPPG